MTPPIYQGLMSFEELVADLGRTPSAARKWLSRHGIRATRRVSVGERATRGVYDGAEAAVHLARAATGCAACGLPADVSH